MSDPTLVPLQDRIAVVTGSSRGIGRAIAAELATRGCHVVLHGRADSDSMRETVRWFRQEGLQGEPLFADFSDPHALASFVESVWQQVGEVDFWINNAGGDVLTGGMARAEFAQRLEYLWRADVCATLMLSRQAGQRMQRSVRSEASTSSGTRAIINVGWDQSARGMAGESGEMFATTKGAIAAFSRSLAQSLAPQIRVNCVAPGWIRTAWGETTSEGWDRRARAESLMERWGTPTDVAQAVCFLCQHSFISGQVLEVNGGFRFGQIQSGASI